MALGLASCSSDEPLVGYEDQVVENDETRYITVALNSPTSNMSRAGEFENGSTSESEVKSLLFVFYDGSGAPTGPAVNLQSDDLQDEDWTTNPDGNNVTRFWTSTIPVNMTQGQNKPVYVMCFVNPIQQQGLTRYTLAEIDALKRSAVWTAAQGFAMSNSVYYGNNPITGQSNVRVMATPIVGDQLYSTEEEAKAAPALDIYVERYAAKIGVNMTPAAVADGYPVKVAVADGTLTDNTIVFTPKYWRPNAIDTETFVTKGFNTQAAGSDPTVPATYAAMTAAFANTGMAGEGLTGWNNQANFRSYWACSPSYYANRYPQCSDDVTEAEEPYAVKYFTYNELVNNVEGAPIEWDATNGFATSTQGDGTTRGFFYSRESTAAIEMLTATDINNKAVPASVVIVGNYQLKDATGNPSTFYLYGKSGGRDVYYSSEAAVEAALISNQNVIFSNVQGTTRATNANNFKVEHPSKAVRNGEIVAGRLVTIQIDPENIPTGLYFNNGGDNLELVTADNVNEANRLLWASASTAEKFEQGLAFFSIPVRHLGWDDTVDLIENAGDNGRATMINWQNLRRGDLGVVRNHVYNYTVTKVSGLGIGLGSVDQPIVPPMDPDNYYVAVKLNVLAWRVVPSHDITL